jgi:hypothetical protein
MAKRTRKKATADTASVEARPKPGAPSEEAIRKRAFELWQARGGEHGHELDDWAQAERELGVGRANG